MRNLNCTVLGPAAASASVTGSQIDSNQMLCASFHAYYSATSSATATIKIQASNDPTNDRYQAGSFTATHWVDVPSASATVTGGAASLITISQCSYRWLRVLYTPSGGGGAETITINLDSLSA